MNPYWLTVMDGVHTLCIAFTILLTVAVLGSVVIMVAAIIDQEDWAPTVKKTTFWLGGTLLVFSMGAVFIPSQKDLRDAYIMAEVAKVATAENLEKTGDALIQRVDRLLDLYKEKK